MTKTKSKFTIFTEDYNVTLQSWVLWNRVFGKELYKMTNRQLSIDSLFVFEDDYVLWGPRRDQFIAAGNYFSQMIKKNPDFLGEIMRNLTESIKNIESFAASLLIADLSAASNKQLFSWYEQACNLWVNCGRWGAIPMYTEMSDEKVSDRIKESLIKILVKYGEPEIVFSRLTTSLKETYLFKEQMAILKLLVNWQKDKNFWAGFIKSHKISELPVKMRSDINFLAKKFGWMQYYYNGSAADINYYYDALYRHRHNPGREISSRIKEKVDLKVWQNRILSNLSIANKKEIKMLQDFAFTKEWRKEIQIYYLNYALQRWFAEIARRLFCTASQAKYLTPSEIEDWLIKGKKPPINKLNARYKNSAILLVDRKEKFFFGPEARRIKRLFDIKKLKISSVKEIKGSVAYPGKATGIVKIVNALCDLGKFQEGDILVSFSTNPSLVPAMNKAAAIITNTGGVTCHAAIVSRELKTPCVIGTKIATQVLHDGDLVEVDGNKGIIKILKKSK